MKAIQLVVLLSLSIFTSFLGTYSATAQSKGKMYNNPLAYIGADGNIYITDLSGTTATRITSDGGPRGYGFSEDTAYRSLRWSPDGTQLISSASNRLHLIISGQTPHRLLPDVEDGYGISAWSPD